MLPAMAVAHMIGKTPTTYCAMPAPTGSFFIDALFNCGCFTESFMVAFFKAWTW
jgi:hypothetical protein